MSSRFHTPPAVARRLLELVAEAAGGTLPPGPVLEPSVGAGALVQAWLDLVAGPASSPGAAERAAALVRERLSAADLDPAAVKATRAALVARCSPFLSPRDPALERVRMADGLQPSEPAALLLCNPPWVSFSGRHRGREAAGAAPPPDTPHARGWPSLHARAVPSLVARLMSHGAAGFVLPGQVASLTGYAPLRRALASRVRVVELLGEGAFPGVVSPACLVALGPATDLPLVTRSAGRSTEIARALLLAEPDRPWLPRFEDLFPAWPPPGFRLVPHAFSDLGLHSGNAAARLFRPHPFPGAVAVLEGRDVTPFTVAPPRRWFDPTASPGPGDYFAVSRWPRARDCPILLRQTATRPVAALNPGYPFRNSVLGCHGVPGFSAAAVVALLNSDSMAQVLAALSPDVRQRTFPQLKIGDLRRLPWPAEPCPEQVRALQGLAAEVAANPDGRNGQARAAIERLAGNIYQDVLAEARGLLAV